MNPKNVQFKNAHGKLLMGHLEVPVDKHPHNFALFAHCFTCTKDHTAVRNISRALVSEGFGVLRFDFTGLGESEGDFADTSFSGNVEDLVGAAAFLKESHKAPTLLVGHSLGGAAVLLAAEKIASVQAVATLAAPSSPAHLKGLLRSSAEEIRLRGEARVDLGGTPFTITRQFLEDLEEHQLKKSLGQLKIPLLLLHSPQDRIVAIEHAEALYKAAYHPKSFISLDGADHLLTNTKDSRYAGTVIAAWAGRYLEFPEVAELRSDHQVVAGLGAGDGYTTLLKAGEHMMVADEPQSFGGNNFGPSPYQLVSAGLAACTAMTLHMYARRKAWPLEEVRVHTSYSKSHAEDCGNCEAEGARLDTFERVLELSGPLDESQKARLLEIANKCPVHRTLHSDIRIPTRLAK